MNNKSYAKRDPQRVYHVKIKQRVTRVLADNVDEVLIYLSKHLNNICDISVTDAGGDLFPGFTSAPDMEHHTCVVTDNNVILR